MKKLMKLFGMIVAVSLAGSVCMADYHGDYRRGDSGRGHGYYDGGRHYGYYRNPRGDLIFGLIGLGVAAAIVSSIDRPTVYVQQPAPVVYQTPPPVVYVQQAAPQPQVIYVPQPQPAPQPIVVQAPIQAAPQAVQQQVGGDGNPPLTITINVQNANGSFTPVALRQDGAQWVGPYGEYYNSVPSVGQLRPLYGR